MKAKVGESLDLNRITFGNRADRRVSFEDARLESTVVFHYDGWITTLGRHAFEMMTTALLFLDRAQIAPGATKARVETYLTSVRGSGSNANL